MKKFKKKSDKNKTPSHAPIILGGRKQKRKELRQQKKELKQAFYLKKFHKSDNGGDATVIMEPNTKEGFSHDQSSEKKIDSLTKLKRQAETKRKKMLKRANKEEDATIQKLEKQLNIKNRQTVAKEKKASSSSRIPKSFMDDGLGYILELCEGGKKVAENIDNLSSANSEEEDEDAMSATADSEGIDLDEDEEEEASSESEIEDSASDEDLVNADVKDDEDQFLEEEEGGTDQDKSDSHDEIEDLEPKKPEKEETWEDIYGRKRDSHGNVLATKYVPPAMRAQSGPGDLSRLEKQLKGQLNRLAESNLQGISRFVEGLYSKNSRNNMNATLFTLLKAAIVLGKAMTPERLVLEHAALVALLHANVGIEVGANITQKWVDTFMDEYRNNEDLEEDSTKELDNMLYFICSLYSFRVISQELIFDILFMLAQKFSIKDIELISLGLRCIGFNLRKDEPSRLKTLIAEIQKKAAGQESDSESMRVKFMLESLMAIKNNNVKKLPNYDPTYLQHLQKVIRNYYRPSASVTPLNVRLNDLLQAETRGKWWIVGSAWNGREGGVDEPETDKQAEVGFDFKQTSSSFSEDLLRLARKMRMNTDTRKVIFCAVMSSSDYMEAFEKLVKLDIKSPMKEREAAFVLTLCCIKEPQVNPFYPKVAAKLCRQDRKFRMSVQCSIWDRLSSIVEGKESRQSCLNLAHFASVLIKDGVLSLSCLKRVEFADMNKELTLFMKTLIKDLLASPNEEERNSCFAFISSNPKFSSLRESLRLFLHHFFRKEDAAFRARIESAEAAMMISSTKKK